jgi:hypothetical protein
LAVCPSLNLLVTSNTYRDTLSVWRLPEPCAAFKKDGSGDGAGKFTHVRTFRTLVSETSHIRFRFRAESGALAFTSFAHHVAHPVLLVTDSGQHVVHVVDVVNVTHLGYLASVRDPKSIAASDVAPLVAVVASGADASRVVMVYQGSGGSSWTLVRELRAGNGIVSGVRFSRQWDGALYITDVRMRFVLVVCIADDTVQRTIPGTQIKDVEEVEGGWLVVFGTLDDVLFVPEDVAVQPLPLLECFGRTWHGTVSMATVPGLGLIVREYGGFHGTGGRMQLWSTPDLVAMACMSPLRVAWMWAVVNTTTCIRS